MYQKLEFSQRVWSAKGLFRFGLKAIGAKKFVEKAQQALRTPNALRRFTF